MEKRSHISILCILCYLLSTMNLSSDLDGYREMTFSTQASFLISLGDRADDQVSIVVSFSATSPSASSTRSPCFFRATLSDASQADAISAYIRYLTKENGIGTNIDTSTTPRGWVTAIDGKKLRVGVPVNAGFTELMTIINNSTRVEEYCIDVFEAVMAALSYGIPYEYIHFSGDYSKLILQVYPGKYDIGDGDAMNEQYDLQYPVTWAMNEQYYLLHPVTWGMWVTSFCSFVLIGFLIRILEDLRGPFWYQVGMTCWFAFSTIVFAYKERVVTNLSRLVLIIWILAILILTQTWLSNLDILIENREYVG